MTTTQHVRRAITLDFFRVTVHVMASLRHAVDDIHRRYSAVLDRNLPGSGEFTRMHDWHSEDNHCSGALLRLRMESHPSIGSLDTEAIRDVPLGPNEAVIESFAFGYFPRYSTLVVHRNRDAGRHGRLIH